MSITPQDPGFRPGQWETAGDHERRIRGLEAADPCECLFTGTSLDELVTASVPNSFWKFNEDAGNTAFDSSDAQDLTVAALHTPPSWANPAGPPGTTTVEFTNTNASNTQELSKSPFTNLAASDFTVAGWAKFNVSAYTGLLSVAGQGASLGQGGNTGWLIGFSSPAAGPDLTKRKLHLAVGNGSITEIDGNNYLDSGTWYFVAFTRTSGTFRLYVDGVLQTATTGAACGSSTSKLSFGHTDGGGGQSQLFDGFVSYWGAWTRALTGAELLAFYNAGVSGGPAADLVLQSDGVGGTFWDYVDDDNIQAGTVSVNRLVPGTNGQALGTASSVATWLTLAGDVSGPLTALVIGAKKVLASMIGSGAAAADTVLQADGSGGASFVARIKSIAKFGSTALAGDVTLTGGANMTLTQTGQNITFAATITGGGAVDSINKTGSTPLTGAVTLTGGTNVTLTQAGQDISIAAAGAAKLYDFTISGTDQASIDTAVDGTTVANFAGYDVLEVFAILRTDDAGAVAAVDWNVNNDANAIYDRQVLSGANGTAAAATSLAQTKWAVNCHGSGGLAGYATEVEATFPGYAGTTFNKVGTLRVSTIDSTAGNNSTTPLGVGWRSTAALIRIKVAAQGAAKLKVGSRLIVFAR